MKYEIKVAKREDIPLLCELFSEGIAFLKAQGVDQWQDGYPNREVANEDLSASASYLLWVNGEAVATMAIFPFDENYRHLFKGEWIVKGEEYFAIHRVCVAPFARGKGWTRVLYEYAENLARAENRKSLRADTHKDNLPMRRALEKNGFIACGEVILSRSGEKRIAYEKLLTEDSMKSKKTVVVATGNKHKLREISEIFPDIQFLSQKEAGFLEEVEETGETFAENAYLKAYAVAKALGVPALADDSGICVNALGGAPGVHSARFCGYHGDDKKNRDLLKEKLQGETDRSAYFCSAIVLCYPDGSSVLAEGKTYGKILLEEEGTGGFGYDCIFYSNELEKSFGVASAEEKNAVSHRFKALCALKEKLGGSFADTIK